VGSESVEELKWKEVTLAATPEALQWQGWGTALKPAHEPIIVCRKPLGAGTVAGNVLLYGTGGLNIDGCRVPTDGESLAGGRNSGSCKATDDGWNRPYMNDPAYLAQLAIDSKLRTANAEALGRFPANLIHDGSDEVLAAFPDAGGQQGDLSNRAACRQSPNGIFGGMRPALDYPARIESDKSAARFFYCAKASKSDRGEGNTHPTVKPQALMRYLVRLVTPPVAWSSTPLPAQAVPVWPPTLRASSLSWSSSAPIISIPAVCGSEWR
jgi:site-specific DNA-methyltransferase (adenine-specific)